MRFVLNYILLYLLFSEKELGDLKAEKDRLDLEVKGLERSNERMEKMKEDLEKIKQEKLEISMEKRRLETEVSGRNSQTLDY